MGRLNQGHLSVEVVAEVGAGEEETEAVVSGEGVTEVTVIQMTGRSVARMTEPMASETIETAVTIRVGMDVADVMREVPATTVSVRSVRRSKRMKATALTLIPLQFANAGTSDDSEKIVENDKKPEGGDGDEVAASAKKVESSSDPVPETNVENNKKRAREGDGEEGNVAKKVDAKPEFAAESS